MSLVMYSKATAWCIDFVSLFGNGKLNAAVCCLISFHSSNVPYQEYLFRFNNEHIEQLLYLVMKGIFTYNCIVSSWMGDWPVNSKYCTAEPMDVLPGVT